MKSKVINVNRSFILKSIVICLFLLYTLMVIDFTLINDNFGRNISNIFLADKSVIKEHLSQRVNVVPFKTVKLFIEAYKDSTLETHSVVENILGNLFVFMPFAFFVPNIFKSVNSFFKFMLAISVTVIVIECLQIIFLTGSADIDDFILNVVGAAVAYGILSIPKIKFFINQVTGGTNESKG